MGSVLYLTATVVYTDPPLVLGYGSESETESRKDQNGRTRVQVRVDSKVRDVEHGETKPTGQFNYTFTVDKDVKVLPRTYTEFMMYIDARRRAQQIIETVEQGEADPDGINRVTE